MGLNESELGLRYQVRFRVPNLPTSFRRLALYAPRHFATLGSILSKVLVCGTTKYLLREIASLFYWVDLAFLISNHLKNERGAQFKARGRSLPPSTDVYSELTKK